ncbi:spindle pole body component 110-like [Nicotiana sylvestris]|uniref:spindle pole body component 110-like n=1 Tax=Nicotiana sylvestris TaxID=4096 RepID=UPI00388C705B
MRDHIIGEDYELWDIITDGPLATIKNNAEGVDMLKTRADCTIEDLKNWEKNAKAKKWLVCGLGPDEYSKIQSCTTAKEVWDTLQEIEWKKERAERRSRKKEQDFIDEFEIINNEKEELSTESMILKAKCKNLESRANENESENTELKNQVLELDTSVLELRSENLKLKLGTGKKKADHTHLTLEENLGKMKDELYRKDEQIRVLKEDLGKVNMN